MRYLCFGGLLHGTERLQQIDGDKQRAIGADHLRILFYHIAPNVLATGFLYTAYGVAWWWSSHLRSVSLPSQRPCSSSDNGTRN